jgi:hypothetical protein
MKLPSLVLEIDKINKLDKRFFKEFAVVILLLIGMFFALFRPATRTTPLQTTQSLVIVLVPNLTLQDLQNGQNAPDLARFLSQSAYGVLPTRGSNNPGKEDLENAIGVLASGTRLPNPTTPTLGARLKEKNITLIPLGADARTLLSLPQEEYPEEDEQAWRMAQYEFPEGHITDVPQLQARIAEAVSTASSSPHVVVAVYDDLQRADSYASVALEKAIIEQRRAALLRLNRLVADLVAPASPIAGSTLLLIAPTPGRGASEHGERFGPVVLWQGNVKSNGLLTSPTTRLTPGLLGATDIATTVMALLGTSNSNGDGKIGVGRAVQITPDDHRLSTRLYHWSAQSREQALLFYLPWILGVTLLLAIWLRAMGYAPLAQTLGIALLTAPLFLTLYASSGQTYLCTALSVVCVGMITWCFPEKALTALRIVATLTVFLLLVDTYFGGAVLSRSPLSWSAGEAVRFYGMGNEMAGVLIGMALLALAPEKNSALPRLLVVLSGMLISLTLAAPVLGANSGGFLAALVGFGCLLIVCQPTHRARIFVFFLIGTAMAIAALLLYEGSRSITTRTHLGEALANGVDGWQDIALRKLEMNAHLVISSPWMVLLGSAIILIISQFRAHKKDPFLLASLAAGVAAFLSNDSGVVAAATLLLPAAAYLLLADSKGDGLVLDLHQGK